MRKKSDLDITKRDDNDTFSPKLTYLHHSLLTRIVDTPEKVVSCGEVNHIKQKIHLL